MAENIFFGTEQAVREGKKNSEVSQSLKKIFGLSPLQPAEVCDCSALEFLSNLPNDKRVEEFWDYLLENYIDEDSTFPPPVWSECTASSLGTTNACVIPCPLQYTVLQCASYNFCSCICTAKNTE